MTLSAQTGKWILSTDCAYFIQQYSQELWRIGIYSSTGLCSERYSLSNWWIFPSCFSTQMHEWYLLCNFPDWYYSQ